METPVARGMFVVAEGPDMAGKSSTIRRLHEHFGDCHKGGLSTRSREPGGTPMAERFRELVKAKDHFFDGEPMRPLTETFLHMAARVQHVEEVIKPFLAKGVHVFCDRYTDSTAAYQGAGKGVPMDAIRYMNGLVVGNCVPDLVLVFDVSPEESLARKLTIDPNAKRDNFEADRYDGESPEFKAAVRQYYLSQCDAQPHRYVLIDTDGKTEDEVFQIALSEVTSLIQRNAQ